MHLLLSGIAAASDHGRRLDRHYQHLVDLERTRPRSGGRRLRRLTALALIRLSLASAAAVRILDACVADDLARRVSPPDAA